VGWSNVPNATENPVPIIQYFYAIVVYDTPLPAAYFSLPSACENATACPMIDHSEEVLVVEDTESCDDSDLKAALIGVSIAVFFVGIAAGCLGERMRKNLNDSGRLLIYGEGNNGEGTFCKSSNPLNNAVTA
jgi:hypothetical protein